MNNKENYSFSTYTEEDSPQKNRERERERGGAGVATGKLNCYAKAMETLETCNLGTICFRVMGLK